MPKPDTQPDIDDDPIAQRQQNLLDRIADRARLIPLGPHSSFAIRSYGTHWPWYNEPIDRLIWDIVAQRLADFAPTRSLIDHAWLFGFHAPPHETWGFVTEPYLDVAAARQIFADANEAMNDWGVEFLVQLPEASAWNPGQCTPVVAIIRPGWIDVLMRAALRWWLDQGDAEEGR
jgi:hypothetical protein